MITQIADRLSAKRRDESGVALITTVLFMVFVFIIVAALTYSSMVAVQIDSSVRSGEKKDSAFDSAVNQAIATSTTGNPNSATTANKCVPAAQTAQGTSYQLYRTANTASPTSLTASGVAKGCPVNGDTYMIVSVTGPTSATNTDGTYKSKTNNYVYRWTSSTAGFDGFIAGTSATTSGTPTINYSTGDLTVTSGNYTCGGNTTINGDVYVPNGTLTMTGNCAVIGDVYADNLSVKSSNVQVGYGGVYSGNVYLTGSITIASGVSFNLGDAGRMYSSGTDTLSLPAATATAPNINALMIVTKGGLNLAKGAYLDSNIQLGGDVVTAAGGATVEGYIRTTGKVNASSTSGLLTVKTSSGVFALSTASYVMYNVSSSNSIEMGTSSGTATQSMNNVDAKGVIYGHNTAYGNYTDVNAGTIWIAGYYKSLTGTFTSIYSSKNSATNLLTNVTYTKNIGVNGTISSSSKISCTYSGVGTCGRFTGKADLYDDPTEISVPKAITWTVPSIQTWKDYSYNQSDWVGYRVVVPSNCDYTTQGAIDQINALSSPTVLDLRKCGTINFTNTTLNIKTSIAIISNSLSTSASTFSSAFKGLNVTQSDTAYHAFYIINPDTIADGAPTCDSTTSTSSTIGQMDLNDTEFSTRLRVATYTPCATTIRYTDPADSWYGQVYGGTLNFTGGSIYYTRVTIPGFPGTSTGVSTTYNASATTRAAPNLVGRF